jgi:hypothetical protein
MGWIMTFSEGFATIHSNIQSDENKKPAYLSVYCQFHFLPSEKPALLFFKFLMHKATNSKMRTIIKNRVFFSKYFIDANYLKDQ